MPATELVSRWGGHLSDRLTRIGASPGETEDERIRRLIWLVTLVLVSPFCYLMALVSFLLDCLPAAALMLAWASLFTSQILLLAVLRRGLNAQAFGSQLSCVLVSLAGVVVMGGPASSGGFVFLGIIGPLYALVFPSRRRAVLLFATYIASLVVGAVLSDRFPWTQPFPSAVNVVFFVMTASAVAGSAFAALYYFVLERDRALRLLREAEEKISRLLESSPGDADTLVGWTESVSREIADVIGADRIGIWEADVQGLVPLADEGLSTPSLEVLEDALLSKDGSFVVGPDGTVVPVAGMTGELCGALVVAREAASWSQSERRLVAGFAHQLGAALDMKRLRRQLAAAEERRTLNRQEMHEQGIATLQLCPRCGRCYDHTASTCTADGSPLHAPHTLPFRLLDRYRFCQTLGEGGMGIVLVAWDEKLQREVAVKLLRPEHFNNPDLKRRFEREARTVAHIQHPGVIGLYDSGELGDGTAFLVMEKLTGHNLAFEIRHHGRGTPAQVAEFVRQGCAALGAAHHAGVVHRDVKPENIFLVHESGGFRVKILDFGLAKSLTVDNELTQTGMLMGTPAYMSPEQVQGEELDARTDVYSFAAVCYEALTGSVLVPRDDLGRILISVLNAEPPPPSSLVPGLPPEVDIAFASALAKDRARRLKDIVLWGSSFVDSLASFAETPPITGWPLPPVSASESTHIQVTELLPARRVGRGDRAGN